MLFAPPDSAVFSAIIAVNQRQQQIMETFFLRAAQDHGNMQGRHRAYAATFLGMLNTYISINLISPSSADSELAKKAVHQFMHGIFS
jgi:TetR/AcrR family transcriptional regulator